MALATSLSQEEEVEEAEDPLFPPRVRLCCSVGGACSVWSVASSSSGRGIAGITGVAAVAGVVVVAGVEGAEGWRRRCGIPESWPHVVLAPAGAAVESLRGGRGWLGL